MLNNALDKISTSISKFIPSPIKNIIRLICNFFSKIFKTIFGICNRGLNLVWRIGVPLLLVALLVVPIFLSLFPTAKKSSSPTTASIVAKADIIKKITIQGTTQYTQQYDLPVYQDSTLTEVLVKQGDKVTAGQVLAKLDFINENKIRSTATENAIKQSEQDLANAQQTLNDLGKINRRNYDQMDTNLTNRYIELDELNQKRVDKVKELSDKREKYVTEKADFQKRYDDIGNFTDVNDAIKQYQDKIDALQNQLNTTTPSTGAYATQTQINTQQAQLETYSKAYTTACPNGVAPTGSTVDCNALYSQFNTAKANISLTQSQLDTSVNQNNTNGSYLQSQINDYQRKITELRQTGYSGNGTVVGNVINNVSTSGGMVTITQTQIKSSSKTPNNYSVGINGAITDTAKNTNLNKQKTDINTDINDRKNWIKQIDDNTEVKTLDDQILAKQKIIDELLASQNLTKANLDQSISNTNQKTATTQTSIVGAKKTLADTLEDITKQEKNHTITAKTDGTIGRVYKDQGLVASTKEVIFSVTSDTFEIGFSVSADNRALIKQGMKVKTDKYKEIDNITVTDTPTVPDATTTASTPTYTLKAKLPKTDKYQYTSGETISVDVIINEQPQVTAIPSSGVSNGKVYVGINPILADNSTKGGFNLPFNIGRNSIPSITGIPNGGGRSGNNGSRGNGGGGTGGNNNFNPSSQVNKKINSADLSGIKFSEIKEITVTTGLDDGQNIEIKDGLKEGEYIITIFPKTQKDQDIAKTDLVKQ